MDEHAVTVIPAAAVAERAARDLGWPPDRAEQAVRQWADAHAVPTVPGWGGLPGMPEAAAEACLADLAASKADADRAEAIARIVAAADSRAVVQPSARERIELLGGAEHASKITANHSIPLDPVKVISLADLDAQREALKATRVPGVAYREPIDRPLPGDMPMPRIVSKTVTEWLNDPAENTSWA